MNKLILILLIFIIIVVFINHVSDQNINLSLVLKNIKDEPVFNDSNINYAL
jgi:predicted small integral membrane protein